jgi:protein-disulfide isomerase
LRRETLDRIIEQELVRTEAQARGIQVPKLLELEVSLKVVEPTSAEINAAIDLAAENSDPRTSPGNPSYNAVRERIIAVRRIQAQRSFLSSLKQKYPVRIFLDPPRADVRISEKDFVQGEPEAPVEVIVFSDFECRFCAKYNQNLKVLQSRFPKTVRISHRDLPLPNHANARSASEAARCAGRQGKYWAMHEMIFENAPKLGLEAYLEFARSINLEIRPFELCVRNHETMSEIEEDVKAAGKLGITGTPTTFVNGQILIGLIPVDTLAGIVAEELARY